MNKKFKHFKHKEKKMKNITKKIVILLLTLIVMISCKGTPEALNEQDASLNITVIQGSFADVIGKELILTGLYINGENTGFDRNALATEGFAEGYTLRFDEERFGGAGAPNRYFGTFSLGEDDSISISPAAATLMAALFEPEVLKEHEFFAWLQNTYKWNITGGNLELHSKADDGTEAVLVFAAE